MIIVVDLDGTLVSKDSSFALWKKIFKANFFLGMKVAYAYFVHGEARAKDKLSGNTKHAHNTALIKYLQKRKNTDRLILATGAPRKTADSFNEQYQLFQEIITSSKDINCIGTHKLAKIREVIGNEPFMYIGDHWYDYPIWSQAHTIGVVRPNAAMLEALEKLGKEIVVFE